MTAVERERELKIRLDEIYRQFSADDEAQLSDDVKEVLSTPAGRRVLMHILNREGVFGPIIGEGANEVMILVGRHNMAQEILGDANRYAADDVMKAMAERNATIRERNDILAKARELYEGTNE